MFASGGFGRHPITLLSAFITLLLLLLGSMLAQNPATSTLASIDGIVTKAGTADALQGVTVTATPENGPAKRSTSDADGKFAIRDLAAGRYVLTLAKTGYAIPRRGAGISNVSVTTGQSLTGIRLQMAATAVVTGKVLDQDGNPLSGITVSVVAPRYEMGRRMLVPIPASSVSNGLSAKTDARGEYRLYGIEPGEYYIATSAERGQIRYYPKADDPADAIALTLGPGSETGGIDIRIAPVPLYAIHLKSSVPIDGISNSGLVTFNVLFSTNAGIQLNRRSRNGWDIRNVVPYGIGFDRVPDGINAGNIVSPGLPPGSYELFINGAAFDSGSSRIAFDITDHDLDLGGLAPLRLTPLSGSIQQTAGVNFDSMRVTLTPIDGHDSLLARITSASARIATDGTFRFVNTLTAGAEPAGSVGDGIYQVGISGLPANMVVATARYGTRDALDNGLHIEGNPNAPLEITIAVGGTVRGVVKKNNNTVSDSLVALIPNAPHRGNLNLYKTAATDQDGNFTIRGVAPGDYGILAWEDVEPNAWLNADFLKPFEPQAQRISIIGTSTTEVIIGK